MFSITDKEQIDSLLKAADSFANPKITLSGTLRKNFDSLILSDLWPLEVPSSLIVNTPDQARLRARSIVHSYGLQNFKGKKFLDFGCGTGECVTEAAKMGVEAFGFDIRKQWPDDTTNITTDIKDINTHSPYDIVALYDVLDHAANRVKAQEIMNRVARVCGPETIVRVRCHPWTSRHGAHLYESINRAYAHILLSEETLAKYLKEPSPVEPLFQTPQMVEIFRIHLDGDKEWQEAVLPIAFVDFILRLK